MNQVLKVGIIFGVVRSVTWVSANHIRRGHSAAAVGEGARMGMTEETFLLCDSQPVHGLRGYLGRMLSDRTLVDDVAQEAYLRFLRAKPPMDWTAEHRKNYLFRIAANLLRDE